MMNNDIVSVMVNYRLGSLGEYEIYIDVFNLNFILSRVYGYS